MRWWRTSRRRCVFQLTAFLPLLCLPRGCSFWFNAKPSNNQLFLFLLALLELRTGATLGHCLKPAGTLLQAGCSSLLCCSTTLVGGRPAGSRPVGGGGAEAAVPGRHSARLHRRPLAGRAHGGACLPARSGPLGGAAALLALTRRGVERGAQVRPERAACGRCGTPSSLQACQRVAMPARGSPLSLPSTPAGCRLPWAGCWRRWCPRRASSRQWTPMT